MARPFAACVSPYFRLFRLSIALTPIADVLAGYYIFASPNDPPFYNNPSIFYACAASIAIFCFGVALNDYIDRNKDLSLTPDRPIPAGDIRPLTALGASFGMAIAAVALAAQAGFGTLVSTSVVLLFVAFYNLASRRYDFLGVINLGLIHGSSGGEGSAQRPGNEVK